MAQGWCGAAGKGHELWIISREKVPPYERSQLPNMLLPEGVAPLSAALVAQRNASGFSTTTPRGSGNLDSSRSSAGDETRLPPPARPHAATIAGPHVSAASSFKTESNSELEAALAALDSDYNRELAELKKKYADKKSELMKSMRSSSVELS